MQKKELIWNIALLLTGLLLVLAYTCIPAFHTIVTPGWHGPNLIAMPFGFVNIWAASLIAGGGLVVFRYVLLKVLAIRSPDLRLIILLTTYLLPLLLILLAYDQPSNAAFTQTPENHIPIEKFKENIKQLRQYGFFKSYSNQSDVFVADILLGRFLRGQGGYLDASSLATNDFEDIRQIQLLRFDTAKTWSNADMEWVVEGDRTYERFVDELGKISEGNFKPTNIEENWLDKQIVELRFYTGEARHTIRPKVKDDWADTDTILAYINQLIKPTEYQFYNVVGDDFIIIGLTNEEKRRITEGMKIQLKNPLDGF